MKERFDGLVEHLLKCYIFLPEAIEILEKSMIELSLQQNEGNQCAASKQLGIHRNTLQRKMVEYGLGNPDPALPDAPLAMDLLIFDLDGTLIDSRLDLAHAVNAARQHMGMPPLA